MRRRKGEEEERGERKRKGGEKERGRGKGEEKPSRGFDVRSWGEGKRWDFFLSLKK